MFNSVSTLQLFNAGLRVWLFMFTVISLGIEGHLHTIRYNIARVNLGIAASVIGLVLSVFVPWFFIFVGSLYNVWLLFGMDFISFALYLSASASLTEQRHVCHDPARGGKCGMFRAGIAFLYMDWIILFFVMLLEIYQFFSEGTGGGSNYGYDSNVRRPATHFRRNKEAPPTGFANQVAVEEPSPQSTHVPEAPPAAQA